jgi:hypothetical protein
MCCRGPKTSRTRSDDRRLVASHHPVHEKVSPVHDVSIEMKSIGEQKRLAGLLVGPGDAIGTGEGATGRNAPLASPAETAQFFPNDSSHVHGRCRRGLRRRWDQHDQAPVLRRHQHVSIAELFNDDALQKGRGPINLVVALPRYSQCDVVRLTEVETEGFGPFHHP